MANPRDYVYNREYHYREQPTTRDDYIAYAQANANYCYQLSLWWLNASNSYDQHARTQSWDSCFSDQNCECTERAMVVECDCDCCQYTSTAGDEHVYETPRREVNLCKDCPKAPPCINPQWLSSHGGSSDRSGNHHGVVFRQNYVRNHATNSSAYEADKGDYDVDDDDNDNGDSGDDDSEEDADSDVNMDIDDNFRKFLEQSEKHRQERERRKQEILKEKDDYIEVGSMHLNTTTCAPSEQPGAKRKEEMNALYGKHASTIMSLEASLQLNYDKNCDMRQPIFWPSIPLRF